MNPGFWIETQLIFPFIFPLDFVSLHVISWIKNPEPSCPINLLSCSSCLFLSLSDAAAQIRRRFGPCGEIESGIGFQQATGNDTAAFAFCVPPAFRFRRRSVPQGPQAFDCLLSRRAVSGRSARACRRVPARFRWPSDTIPPPRPVS